MSVNRAISLVLGVLALTACVLLLVTDVTKSGYECGSVLSPAPAPVGSGFDGALDRSFFEVSCGKKLGTQLWGVVLTGLVGAVLVIAGISIRSDGSSAKAERGSGLTDQLARLGRMHRAGELDDAEYRLAKSRLLGDSAAVPESAESQDDHPPEGESVAVPWDERPLPDESEAIITKAAPNNPEKLLRLRRQTWHEIAKQQGGDSPS